MLGRVTAGEVLERVVQALADMRSSERLLAVILTETIRMLDAQGAYLLWLVGERLARVPGASTWFRGGVIAYDNAAKVRLLGVPESLIEEHGAVSAAVAATAATSTIIDRLTTVRPVRRRRQTPPMTASPAPAGDWHLRCGVLRR